MRFDSALYLVVMLCLLFKSADAEKRRAWLGPNNLVQGTFPPRRADHRIVNEDIGNKIYLFGGRYNFYKAGNFEDGRRDGRRDYVVYSR
jgi:hypothetical protein